MSSKPIETRARGLYDISSTTHAHDTANNKNACMKVTYKKVDTNKKYA